MKKKITGYYGYCCTKKKEGYLKHYGKKRSRSDLFNELL